MFSIDNFPPKNLSATNCFRQQKYFERVFWGTGRTFFFWLNEISTTKNMADTFSVAHISAVALSGTTSHPDLNSIEDPRGGSPPPPHIWQPQPDAARIWKLSDSRQTCCDSVTRHDLGKFSTFFDVSARPAWERSLEGVPEETSSRQRAEKPAKVSKNRPQTLQNRVLGLPKSSLEPPRRYF